MKPATPLPWKVEPVRRLGKDTGLVRLSADPTDPANAAYIVHAANLHERLVKGLQKLAVAAAERESTMGDPCRLIEVKANLEAAAKSARQLLSEAEGRDG